MTAAIDRVSLEGKPDATPRVASLDGIRAIAVVAVMLFHFGQGWLPGGYIGVDVFFVLSGFLITSLLIQRAPAPFSARHFWERRARRLFPALSLMLAAVFVYALTVPPLEQAAIRGQGLATILYVNNWYLLGSGSTYFDAYQAQSPLLHTWTLSVEEQFYVLLPALLMLVIAVKRFAVRPLLGLLPVLALASTMWTFWLGAHDASVDRMYFGTDTRAQQLLMGAVLAVLVRRSVIRGGTPLAFIPRGRGVVGLAGLTVLLGMFLFWPEGRLVAYQLPVAAVASAALIVGALDSGTRISTALSLRPLVAIGIISYGLYLWHWPIAVMVGDQQTNAATPIRLILTFAIATASYLFVEKPIRSGRVRLRWFVPAAVALLVMAFICTPKASQALYAKGLPDHAAPEYRGEGVRTFFVGDSISASLWLPAAATPPDGLAITGSFLLGCPMFGLEHVTDGQPVVVAPDGVDCSGWEGQWRQDMTRLRPQLGVFVGSSIWQFDVLDEDGNLQPFGTPGYANRLRQGLDNAFNSFVADQVVITSVPCTYLPPNPVNDLKNDRSRTAVLNQILRDYAASRNYAFVDLGQVTCDNQQPETLYIDGLHFSPEGAAGVWEALAPSLRRVADEL